MVFVWKHQQFGRNASEFGSIESLHALGGQNAVIFFTMDAQNGRIPVLNEFMRWIGKRTLCHYVFRVPVRPAHIPIFKPHFFGFQVLSFTIKNAAVRDECFKAFLMVSCQPVYGETAVRSADTTQAVFIHVGFSRNGINGWKIVQHILASIISADLLFPLLPHSRNTAPIGCYNDVPFGCHQLKVPTVGPKLPECALWAACTEQDGRIGLCRIKIRRINHPSQHFLVIGGLDHPFFHATHFELLEDFFVFIGQSDHFSIQRLNSIKLVGPANGVFQSDQLVSSQFYFLKIGGFIGYLFDGIAQHIDGENLSNGLNGT